MKRTILAAIAATAMAVFLLPGNASAQDTVPIFVVHGINVADETAVNVCLGEDETPLLSDFVFSDVAGPLDLEVGATLPITVYLAPATCGDADPIIEQVVTVPTTPAAIVATGDGDGGFQLTPYALDLECADEGQGRLTGIHASADTGEVTVTVAGNPAGQLSFPETLAADLPVGEYPVEVLLGETAVVGPADIPVENGVNTLVFVTGNIPLDGDGDDATAVVAIVEGVEVGTCGGPAPTPTPVPETPTGPGTQPGTIAQPTGAPLSLTG